MQDHRYDELIERTKSGHVDVAIMYGPLGDLTGLTASMVTTEPIVVALSADHRLAQEPYVAIGDLAGEGFALPWKPSSANSYPCVKLLVSPRGRPRARTPRSD
ncbi:LysR substrate-binding domain-containing protein [Mycobacteroides chelonae]|uniref:LysR substrate-binding domain-containing protein n=1 Tax=Mycobacteroides chelonae TaxID=1774 RepID=UPI00399B034A